MDWLLLIGVIVVLIGSAVMVYRHDRSAERRRTRDALGPALSAEIDAERRAALDRKEQFQQAIEEAKRRIP